MNLLVVVAEDGQVILHILQRVCRALRVEHRQQSIQLGAVARRAHHILLAHILYLGTNSRSQLQCRRLPSCPEQQIFQQL